LVPVKEICRILVVWLEPVGTYQFPVGLYFSALIFILMQDKLPK
jgi:hypothetical protein